MTRYAIRSFLMLVFVFTALTACAVPGKPSVVIASPPSGSTYHEGEDIAVQSTAVDASGITRVELLVDGAIARVDPSPTAQGQPSFSLIQTWQALQGTHVIGVRAYNSAGVASDPAAISVTVLPNVAPATATNTPGAPVPPPPPAITITPLPLGALTPTAIPPTIPPTSCTDNAAFVADVTVPDGTVLAAGQAFNKIWRVLNNGTCTWGAGYQFAFVAGESMAAVTLIAPPTTAPGATADLLIPMVAPAAAGLHAGQWRLRNASGNLFGVTVVAKINTLGAPPPSTGCVGIPNIASFTASAASTTPGGAVTLNWGPVTGAESAEIDQGLGGVETPGSRVVNPTVTTTYTLIARCGVNVKTAQVTIAVISASAVPPAPTLNTPADGWVFRNFPRTASFSWSPVSFPGGVTYNIEIQIDYGGGWAAQSSASSLATTSFNMTTAFGGDNSGRWRVWATSPTAGDGTRSGWRSFSFNTSAAQYSGTWLNDDSGTGGVTRIIISNSGQTLSVHPYGKCSPTDCDWGTKSQTFNGEPFVIAGFPGGGSHQLTITLNNAAGTSLKAIDFNGSSTFTYTFHR